jgi:hypothetical protein
MTEDFYLVSVPDEHRQLGLKLRPLSLGHLILLNRVGSAFVGGGRPDFSDLAISVLICSLSYRDGISILRDHSDAEKAMKKWHATITGENSFAVRFCFRKARQLDLKAECEAFGNYMAEGSRMPYYSFNPGDFGDLKCPMVQIVKVTLMRDLHIPETELMDRSWSLCLWDYITLKALGGHIKIQDANEIDRARKDAEELQAAIASGRFKMN